MKINMVHYTNLNNEVANDSTIIRMHPRTKRVENTRNTNFNFSLTFISIPKRKDNFFLLIKYAFKSVYKESKHTSWFPPLFSLHHSKLLDQWDSHVPNNLHFVDVLQDPHILPTLKLIAFVLELF